MIIYPPKKKKKKKSENQFSIYIGESELKCMYVCVCISDISIIEQIKYKSIHLKLQEFTPIWKRFIYWSTQGKYHTQKMV